MPLFLWIYLFFYVKIVIIVGRGDFMIKILFICHGNICRSPMAEFVMKDLVEKRGIADEFIMDMVKKQGLEGDFVVSSCATSCDELGNGVYPPVKRLLNSIGINSDGKYSVQLKKSDYNNYDLFIGMDCANIRNMHRIFGSDPDNKIKKMMSFCGSDSDVADPWYTRDFDLTYSDIKSS